MPTFRDQSWDADIWRRVAEANEYDIGAEGDPRSPWAGSVIDIGGHIGSFAWFAVHSLSAPLVLSLEPDAGNFALLQANLSEEIAAGRVIAINKGIGNPGEKLAMRTNTWPNTGGLEYVSSEKGTAETTTLDVLIDMVPPPILLKLDCEGREYKTVLDSEHLGRVSFAVGEFHDQPGLGPETLSDAFVKKGFHFEYHYTEPGVGMFRASRREVTGEELERENALHAFSEATVHPPVAPEGFAAKGIVIVAGGMRLFACAYVCIRSLRDLGCTLPVQIWYLGEDERVEGIEEWMKWLDVEFIDARVEQARHGVKPQGGWELKPFAIMRSRFREVLLLDADNTPAQDPTFLFDTSEYRHTGAIFWPDRGRFGPNHQLWTLCGVEYRDEPEFESGQIAVDKVRHWGPMTLALEMNNHSRFWYRHMHGDKDTYHMAWRKLGAPYAMAPQMNDIGMGPDGSMYQHDFDGKVLFQHRSPGKWSLTGENAKVRGFLREDECLKYLEEFLSWCRSATPPLLIPRDESLLSAKTRAAMKRLSTTRWFLQLDGGKKWAMMFDPLGRITLGKLEEMDSWVMVGEDPAVLRVRSDRGIHTFDAEEQADGSWSGRFVRMHKSAVTMSRDASFIEGLVNKREYRVLANIRSGHHPVMLWIADNMKGSGVLLNSAHCVKRSPYDAWDGEANWMRLLPKDYLIYNVEANLPQDVYTADAAAKHDEWVGPSENRYEVIVIRDAANNLASVLKWLENDGLGAIAGETKREKAETVMAVWDSHARWILENKGVIGIGFYRWLVDPAYRFECAERLGFTEKYAPQTTFQRTTQSHESTCHVFFADWARSSFEIGTKYHGAYDTAREVAALRQRWLKFRDDPVFVDLMTPERLELSVKVCGYAPDF